MNPLNATGVAVFAALCLAATDQASALEADRDTKDEPKDVPEVSCEDPAFQKEKNPLPIVRVAPNFPKIPSVRKVVMVLAFTIAADGTVKDVRVVETTDDRFNYAAKKAVQAWRYCPQIRNGQAVERKNIRVKIKFEKDY